ncbi:MAG: MFS transporter [Proteobacteria bacterium]|nr:MFS transporter [Pseudomonadota bacterium]
MAVSPTPSPADRAGVTTAALVLALCFALALVARGTVESFTTFLIPLGEEFGWSRTALNSVYAVYALTAAAAAPMVGWILDRWGPKRLYLLGIVLMAAGLTGAASASALWQFALCLGVLVGFAYIALSPLPHAVVVSRWFPHRLSSAMGVVQASNGLGIFLIVPLAQLLIAGAGWRWAYAGLALLVACLLVPVSFAKRATLERGRAPASAPARDEAAAAPPASGASDSPAWTLRRALGNVSFWCLFAMFFFTSVGNFSVVPQMVPLLVSTGVPALKAASVFGVLGTCAMVGLLGYGWLSDRIGIFPAATLSYLGSVGGFLTLMALIAAPGEALLWTFVVLFGPSMGSRFPMVSAYAARLFRGPNLGRIFGAICVSQGIGTAIGSFAGGLMHDYAGGYRWVTAFALVNMLFAYAPFVIVRVRGLH